MDYVVVAERLTKHFGHRAAVRGVDLRVRRGEIFGLVGPDGAGKTTTIRMLCGALAADGGTARVAGFDLARHPEKVKEHVGYMAQRFALYEDLTVAENLRFFADLYRVTRAQRERREAELLRFSRLELFRDRPAGLLSGGMKQKLALACMLIHEPRILLLDEPTTGVDPVSRRDFWHILHALLAEGITILYSTPYMDEAERCSTVAFLSGGRVMAAATPQQLKRTLDAAVLELHAGPDPRLRPLLLAVPGVREVQTFGDRLHVVADVAATAVLLRERLTAAGIAISSLRSVPPSLEDVFVHLDSISKTSEEEQSR